jgi:DNA-binding MarR family transcriptional regulator
MTNPFERERVGHQGFRHLFHELGVKPLHGLEVVRQIHLLANLYEALTDEQLRAHNLSQPRWSLLLRLWGAEHLGVPCVRPTQLSHTQGVSKNTISTHLRSLEEQGLIERELDPDDRRQFRIRLSEAGRALVQAATPGHIQFLNSLTADLTAQEVEQLTGLLLRLHDSLLRHGGMEGRCGRPGGEERTGTRSAVDAILTPHDSQGGIA